MAANNLRIIYKNVADSAAITTTTPTSGVTSLSNLKKNPKSLVWRSVGTSATIVVNLSKEEIVTGVILPFCNLSSTATIRIVTNTGLDTLSQLACPYQALGQWDWGQLPLGVNSYSYGGGTYARIWFNSTACSTITINIYDPDNPSGYLELSRLVIGRHWSPKFNTSFGLSVGTRDLSTHERSESGDLITTLGTKYTTMKFDLQWLTGVDRLELTQLLKTNSLTTPLFISLFPNDEDSAKEQDHQIYGKLSQMSDIVHPMFGIYSSSIEIEEV